jgi:hypothetical protein
MKLSKILLSSVFALALVFGTVSAVSPANAKTFKYTTYNDAVVSKDSCNLGAPSVIYTKPTKVKYYDKTTSYEDSVGNTPLVGQTIKVGYETNKNLSSKSKKVYKKLLKTIKIKSVKWYSKTAKGKTTVLSSKKTWKVSKAATGKKLFASVSYTCQGVPGTQQNTYNLTPSFKKGLTGKDAKSTHQGVASKGAILIDYIDFSSDDLYKGDDVTAKITTKFTKKYSTKVKKLGGVKYKYQWYVAKGNGKFTKISGKAATKKHLVIADKYEGKNLALFVTATKKGFYSDTYTAEVYVNSGDRPTEP